jgi:hypothetical protein
MEDCGWSGRRESYGSHEPARQQVVLELDGGWAVGKVLADADADQLSINF